MGANELGGAPDRGPPLGKSRVVINPIQTRLADRLHAQRCRTTACRHFDRPRTLAKSVADAYDRQLRESHPARLASLAGFSLLGDSRLRRVTPPPGSIDAQNLTCELISEFVSSAQSASGLHALTVLLSDKSAISQKTSLLSALCVGSGSGRGDGYGRNVGVTSGRKPLIARSLTASSGWWVIRRVPCIRAGRDCRTGRHWRTRAVILRRRLGLSHATPLANSRAAAARVRAFFVI